MIPLLMKQAFGLLNDNMPDQYRTTNGEYGKFADKDTPERNKDKNSANQNGYNSRMSKFAGEKALPRMPVQKGDKNDIEYNNDYYGADHFPAKNHGVRRVDSVNSLRNGFDDKYPTGLPNIGNTCYMNATLQCLFSTINFTAYFSNGRHLTDGTTDIALCENFTKLYMNARRTGLTPKTLSSSLQDLKGSVQKLSRRFEGTAQNDAHEFLRILLEGIHNELNTAPAKKQAITDPSFKRDTTKNMADSLVDWESYSQTKDDSIVTKIFGGVTVSQVECSQCRKLTYTFENFLDLSLSLKKAKLFDLAGCLKEFIKEEVLEDFFCKKCSKKTRSYKKMTIVKAPEVLVIQLKRFEYDKTSKKKEKIEENIKFPIKGLSLADYLHDNVKSKDVVYDLFGIVNHEGGLSSGHYTAQCLENGSWNDFNDHRVTELSSERMVRDYQTTGMREPYMLFYVRV